MTVRDEANHCLFSAKTFASGGTFDAARSADAEKLLALAAAAPELLAALEWLVDDWERATERTLPDDHEAKAAIAKAKGGEL